MSLAVEQHERYADSMRRRDRRAVARAAVERRQREEVAEARALGVAVVDKIRVDRTWSEEEDAVLRALYPDYTNMQRKLPHRSYSAIKFHCQTLRLAGTNPARTPWKGTEIKVLRQVFPTLSKSEVMAALPGRTWIQIKSQGKDLRLKRPAHAYSSTGIPVIDEIRQRAADRGVTMVDLDVMAEAGAYFSRRHWRGPKGHLSMNKVARAVEALGGRLVIQWEADGD